MQITQGRLCSLIRSTNFSVCGRTPITAPTVRMALSATWAANRVSLKKLSSPGVSMKYTSFFCQVRWLKAALMEILRLVSSGSKSMEEVPSSTFPNRFREPAVKRRASARVDLPLLPWPRKTTFLMCCTSCMETSSECNGVVSICSVSLHARKTMKSPRSFAAGMVTIESTKTSPCYIRIKIAKSSDNLLKN